MQLNKKNLILDKAKMICLKLDKVFLIFPYTISKIELRKGVGGQFRMTEHAHPEKP